MKIHCLKCGIEGEIEVQGLNSDKPSALIFRHMGHNPFSGHLHYQCPVCEIVILVDPMTVLDGLLSGQHHLAARKNWKNQKRQPIGELILRRIFHDQQTGPC